MRPIDQSQPELQHGSDVVLRTAALSKRYGDLVAVDQLDLEVQRGEIVGLLGPNGAGKTTTVNMVLGVLSPTAGRVLLFGRDLQQHRSEVLRRVNFASAYAGLPRNLTLRENLLIFSDFYEVPEPEQRIREVLAELELTALEHRRVMELSAGQRMRAVLAKAVLSSPELLLLDEPTASLDPDTAGRVREYLGGLARRGVTLLWTSHNMAEVERHCTRVIFLHRGRIVLDGPPREIARRSGRVLVRLKPLGPLPAELRDRLDGALRESGGGWVEVSAADEAAAAALVAEVQTQVGLTGLELRQPSLEDIFVQLAREGAA